MMKHVMETLRSAYEVIYGTRNTLEFQNCPLRDPLLRSNIFQRQYIMNSLHVAVCSRKLHMLSKVPEEVVEKGWNKGKVWIEGADPEVVSAYAEQADKDLVDFLECRKDELKIGGSLFMLMDARPSGFGSQLCDSDLSAKHHLNIYMDRAWQELVDEDGLEVEKRDGFNIPIYLRNQEEVKAAIDRCGGFKIDKIVNLKIPDHMNAIRDVWTDNPEVYGVNRAQMAREAIGDITENYLGDEMNKKLFERYATVAAQDDEELLKNECFFEMIAVSATRV